MKRGTLSDWARGLTDEQVRAAKTEYNRRYYLKNPDQLQKHREYMHDYYLRRKAAQKRSA